MKKRLAATLLALACTGLYAKDWHVDANAQGSLQDGSPQAPFQTIAKALWKSKHGDTIIVQKGTYRESLSLYNKKGDQTLTLKAAPGARPVISGFKLLTEWTKDDKGYYTAKTNFRPQALLLDGEFQQLARYPEVGWLNKTQTGKDTFTSNAERDIPAGASCYIWYTIGNVFGEIKIKESPKRGSFVFEPNRARLHKTMDQIYFRNHPDLITKNGQWAWKQLDKKTYQVTIKCDTPIQKHEVEVAGQHMPIRFNVCNNMTISGFDIMGSNDSGIQIGASQNMHFSDLGIFWNSSGGYIRGCKNVSFENCRIAANQSGLTTMDNDGITFRKCDVGYNCEDGIRVTWKSKNALIESCRIHHQLWRGHPDNTQFYRGVDGVTIKDTLYFNGFQGIMAEQVKNFTLDNNLFVGSGAVQVIWGHNSCFNIVMNNNTVLFGGWGGVTCTGSGFKFTGNVLQDLSFQKGPHVDRKYEGRDNIFLTRKAGVWRYGIDNKWPWSFDEYVKISGEQNSIQQAYPVPGMPVAMAIIHESKVALATRDTFHYRGNADFQVGDTVEVCFDGVPRTITATTKDSITVNPPLKNPPSHGYILLNWKNQKDMVWKPQFNKKVGSTLSYEDIRLDRCTTVPMPAKVKKYIDDIDALIIW